MRRLIPSALCLLALCAGASSPNRFALVRSDADAADDGPAGVFSLDDSAIRLSCVEEEPRRPAEDGPFVAVLCHGLGGRKESPLFDAVSKAVRGRGISVARFDFNGHGESEGPFERMTVSNEVLDVETVVDYYRNVRGARVALVGYSQGGVVAALAASRLGADSVEALALLAPAAVLREDAQRGRIFDAVFDPLDPPAAIPVMDGRLLLGRDYVLDAQQTDPYAAIAAYGGPLLVVHGQGDTVVPWSCGQRFLDEHPGDGGLHLLRTASHDFKGWEDSVADAVADFLAARFGHAEDVPAEPVVAAPAEEIHAESAENAEPVPVVAAPAEETHAESSEAAESVPEVAAPVEEIHAEAAESVQSIPVELPPDIRGDMQSFLHALDTQAAAEPVPEVAVPAEEPHAESAEPAEPVPEVAVPAEEPHAESAEVAEPVPEVAIPAEETHAESAENAEPVSAVAVPAEEPHAESAEPVPEVAIPAEETHAESAENAEPVSAVAVPAEEPHADSAEGGEAAVDSPKSVNSVQDLAEAYPSLPIAPNGSVINILAAPNGLTWQGLEVEEEDMIDRLRIFGASIPDAYVRIQAFPETPFERVRALAVAAKDAGFSRISVVLPSAR